MQAGSRDVAKADRVGGYFCVTHLETGCVKQTS